jgi:hypothetical protein
VKYHFVANSSDRTKERVWLTQGESPLSERIERFARFLHLRSEPKGWYDSRVNHWTPRLKGRGLPFDRLKAPSTAEGLEVYPERRLQPRFERRGFASPNV